MKCLAALLILMFILLPVSAHAAARFLVACTSTCTWDASTTSIWSTTSGGSGGSSVPGSGDTVTLDANSCTGGVTCTITVNTTITVQSITMGACTASTTGCVLDFSVNNNNVTLSVANNAFSGTGTGTRTLKMGNGTWTMNGTTAGNAAWTMSVTTNLTFNANSSTISITGSSTSPVNFNGGGLTYNALTIGGSARGGIKISGANTFASLTITAPNSVLFPNGVTTTITNLIESSQAAANPILIASDGITSNAVATISSANSPTLSWTSFKNTTWTGGGTFAATSSQDYGLNTGITITAPSSGSSGGFIIGG
jgi:hypothetical protein